MAWNVNEAWHLNQIEGKAAAHDLETDVIKIALFTSAVAPNSSTNTTLTGAGLTEVTGTGYTAAGEIAVITVDRVTAVVTINMDDVIWSKNAGGFTNARHAVIYETVSDQIIADLNMTTDQDNVNSLFIISFPTGIAVSTIS